MNTAQLTDEITHLRRIIATQANEITDLRAEIERLSRNGGRELDGPRVGSTIGNSASHATRTSAPSAAVALISDSSVSPDTSMIRKLSKYRGVSSTKYGWRARFKSRQVGSFNTSKWGDAAAETKAAQRFDEAARQAGRFDLINFPNSLDLFSLSSAPSPVEMATTADVKALPAKSTDGHPSGGASPDKHPHEGNTNLTHAAGLVLKAEPEDDKGTVQTKRKARKRDPEATSTTTHESSDLIASKGGKCPSAVPVSPIASVETTLNSSAGSSPSVGSGVMSTKASGDCDKQDGSSNPAVAIAPSSTASIGGGVDSMFTAKDLSSSSGVSEYEKLREANMARNKRMMSALGLDAERNLFAARRPGRGGRRSDGRARQTIGGKQYNHSHKKVLNEKNVETSGSSSSSSSSSPAEPARRSLRKLPRLEYSKDNLGLKSHFYSEGEDEYSSEDDPNRLPKDLQRDVFPAQWTRLYANQPPAVATAFIAEKRFVKVPQTPSFPSSTTVMQPEVVDLLSFEAITAALEQVHIGATDGRANVRRSPNQEVRSFCTGASPARKSGGIQVAEASRQRPRLTRLLVAFGRATIPDPEFRFNAIQINKDYATAMHTDKCNLGPSYIIALGDWPRPGGELWAHDLGAVDVHHRWQRFDGNTPHCTLPWKGTEGCHSSDSSSNEDDTEEEDCDKEIGRVRSIPTARTGRTTSKHSKNAVARKRGVIPKCPQAKERDGHRYSLVYYTNRHFKELGEFESKFLIEELGFLRPEKEYPGFAVDYRSNFHITVEQKIASANDSLRLWMENNRPSLLPRRRKRRLSLIQCSEIQHHRSQPSRYEGRTDDNDGYSTDASAHMDDFDDEDDDSDASGSSSEINSVASVSSRTRRNASRIRTTRRRDKMNAKKIGTSSAASPPRSSSNRLLALSKSNGAAERADEGSSRPSPPKRITTVGAMVFGLQLGVAKLVKTFASDERTIGQNWGGSFVGTVRYYEEPFFGIFYDDGDFEEMDLEEMASCHCRPPDATAPSAARAALRAREPHRTSPQSSESSNRNDRGGNYQDTSTSKKKSVQQQGERRTVATDEIDTAELSYASFSSFSSNLLPTMKAVGFALAPVTLTPEQLDEARKGGSGGNNGGKDSNNDGVGSMGRSSVEAAVNQKLYEEMRRRLGELKNAVRKAVERGARKEAVAALRAQEKKAEGCNRSATTLRATAAASAVACAKLPLEAAERLSIYGIAAVLDERDGYLDPSENNRVSLFDGCGSSDDDQKDDVHHHGDSDGDEDENEDGITQRGGRNSKRVKHRRYNRRIGDKRGKVRELRVRWCRQDAAVEITWERRDTVVLFSDFASEAAEAAGAVIAAAQESDECRLTLFATIDADNEGEQDRSVSCGLESAPYLECGLDSEGTGGSGYNSVPVVEDTDRIDSPPWTFATLQVGSPKENSGEDVISESILTGSSSSLWLETLGLELELVDVASPTYGMSPPPPPPEKVYRDDPMTGISNNANVKRNTSSITLTKSNNVAGTCCSRNSSDLMFGDSRVVSAGLLFDATVSSVRAGFPAETAGLRVGDIICAISGVTLRPVATIDAVKDVLNLLGWPSYHRPAFMCIVARPNRHHLYHQHRFSTSLSSSSSSSSVSLLSSQLSPNINTQRSTRVGAGIKSASHWLHTQNKQQRDPRNMLKSAQATSVMADSLQNRQQGKQINDVGSVITETTANLANEGTYIQQPTNPDDIAPPPPHSKLVIATPHMPASSKSPTSIVKFSTTTPEPPRPSPGPISKVPNRLERPSKYVTCSSCNVIEDHRGDDWIGFRFVHSDDEEEYEVQRIMPARRAASATLNLPSSTSSTPRRKEPKRGSERVARVILVRSGKPSKDLSKRSFDVDSYLTRKRRRAIVLRKATSLSGKTFL